MRRLAAGVLISLLALQSSHSLIAQQAGTPQPPAATPVQQSQQASLPDSPTPAAVDSQSPDQGQASTTQAQPENPQSVGTAAAPYMKPSGTAASRPAGAAIAPGKQRRVRSFVIKFGLIAGAAAAGGVVVALSAGSRSRPQ